jgi:hypothetical protein
LRRAQGRVGAEYSTRRRCHAAAGKPCIKGSGISADGLDVVHVAAIAEAGCRGKKNCERAIPFAQRLV